MKKIALLSLFVFLVGCHGGSALEMPRIPLPHGYVDELTAMRADRDRYFVDDPASPLTAEARESFAGLDYYAPNEAFYFVGEIEFLRAPEPLTMTTTAGQQREAERVGVLHFSADSERYSLQVYRLLDSEGLFLPFQDATTGSETYDAGRYINLVPTSPRGGPWVLDFNRAHNPSCAYGDPERFACPVTPPANRLALRIEAGERGYEKIQ